MAIDISVHCHDGLLPDIILLLTQGYYHRGEGLSLQPMKKQCSTNIQVLF